MNHKQILTSLAARGLVKSIDEDLRTLIKKATLSKLNHEKQLDYILPKLFLRWNCVLNIKSKKYELYKEKTWLALAVLLHQYGFSIDKITKNAIKSIDEINKKVALSDSFFRKSNNIKTFLKTKPKPLTKAPNRPDEITFYRAEDIISFQLKNKFYIAYIHEICGINETPIIEFYDTVLNKLPSLEIIKKLKKANGDQYKRAAKYYVSGIKYLPDPANQIHLICGCRSEKPLTNHLEKPIGQYTVTDIFEIQNIIKADFSKK
jgi:hypothetical protein